MTHQIATPKQLAYLDSLVDYIIKSGGLQGRTVEQAILEANDEAIDFIREVIENKTDKAHAVREVMTDEVWARCRARVEG